MSKIESSCGQIWLADIPMTVHATATDEYLEWSQALISLLGELPAHLVIDPALAGIDAEAISSSAIISFEDAVVYLGGLAAKGNSTAADILVTCAMEAVEYETLPSSDEFPGG